MSDDKKTDGDHTDRPAGRDEDSPSDLIPDADAEPTAGEKYSRDERDHGRQDYGP